MPYNDNISNSWVRNTSSVKARHKHLEHQGSLTVSCLAWHALFVLSGLHCMIQQPYLTKKKSRAPAQEALQLKTQLRC